MRIKALIPQMPGKYVSITVLSRIFLRINVTENPPNADGNAFLTVRYTEAVSDLGKFPHGLTNSDVF